MKKKPTEKPYFCKFYLTEDELQRLNEKVAMTHFNRTDYLDFLIRGIQVKERLPKDLNDLQVLLFRLYTPLQELQWMTYQRFPSVCKRVGEVLTNMGNLVHEIYDTFAISNEIFLKTEDILKCVKEQNR